MSLVEYRRKRRFDQTNEPEPGKALPQGQRAIFVVQLHHASRRHYDFRLQIGDALKSWAVPKGPSYDPKVKRMAVEVEDHPVDYASFEGEIPKGQYGGGHVAQFDHGVWATQGDPEAQLAKGHLRFELFGTKLKGGWHLVRSGKPARQPQWLLFKDDDAYTKQDVWDYYSAVMDHLLPEVINRPLSIIRCPAGTGKPCFFQKHHTAGLELVDSVKLKEDSGINAHYLVVRDAASLLELVQFNALEFHPWGSHAEEPDRADRVVFDLDPGPDVPFAEVKKAATDIRKLLAQLELESFLRVSGGKGLHVVVPLNPGCDWDLTKRFAKGFADALAQSEPQRFLATATKALRNKRIFVDYLRNGRGATAVASYSLRGRPGAPVAMPLAWSELPNLKRADAFTIKDVPGKLKRRRKDPWEGIDALKQNLSKWARND